MVGTFIGNVVNDGIERRFIMMGEQYHAKWDHLNKCKGGFTWDRVCRPPEIILLLPYNFVVARG